MGKLPIHWQQIKSPDFKPQKLITLFDQTDEQFMNTKQTQQCLSNGFFKQCGADLPPTKLFLPRRCPGLRAISLQRFFSSLAQAFLPICILSTVLPRVQAQQLDQNTREDVSDPSTKVIAQSPYAIVTRDGN